MADEGNEDLRSVPVEDLTPEEATRIIHSHRKIRYGMHHPEPPETHCISLYPPLHHVKAFDAPGRAGPLT